MMIAGPFHAINHFDRIEQPFAAIRHAISQTQIDPHVERRNHLRSRFCPFSSIEFGYKGGNQQHFDNLSLPDGTIAIVSTDSRGATCHAG